MKKKKEYNDWGGRTYFSFTRDHLWSCGSIHSFDAPSKIYTSITPFPLVPYLLFNSGPPYIVINGPLLWALKVWDDQVSLRAIFRMTKIRTLNYPTSITWRSSYHLTNSNGGNKGSSLTPLNHFWAVCVCVCDVFLWYIVLRIIKLHNMICFGIIKDTKLRLTWCFSQVPIL